MKLPGSRSTFLLILCAAGFFLFTPCFVYSGILYKSYIVKKDRGIDILCDAHIIQKNDSVGGLILQKGEMSQSDFSEFLSILKRLNPHIPDLSNIKPGEHLFIPIKKLPFDTIPGQATGVVTIPFITVSKAQQMIRGHSEKYRVQKGDCISVLIARRFGPLGSSSYGTGIALFERANSSIKNLNRIYPGQTVYIPNPSIQNEPWYSSIFPAQEKILPVLGSEVMESYTSGAEPSSSGISKTREEIRTSTPLSRIAMLLNAKLTDHGSYFFPVKGEVDVHLDLSLSPLLEFVDGRKFLFLKKEIHADDLQAIRSFWKKVEIIPVDPDPTVEQAMDSLARVVPEISPNQPISFSDKGIRINIKARWTVRDTIKGKSQTSQTAVFLTGNSENRVSEPVIAYLGSLGIHVMDLFNYQGKEKELNTDLSENRRKEYAIRDILRVTKPDIKNIIKDIFSGLDFSYSPDITISFPYAGVQVKALSNLLTSKDGKVLILDFGDLQGDAVKAIRGTGFNIIQIPLKDNLEDALKKIFAYLNINSEANPTLFVTDGPYDQKISLAIPGFSISKENNQKILLTHAHMDENALLYLKEHFSKIITVNHDEWSK
jgi:hypothetical protein